MGIAHLFTFFGYQVAGLVTYSPFSLGHIDPSRTSMSTSNVAQCLRSKGHVGADNGWGLYYCIAGNSEACCGRPSCFHDCDITMMVMIIGSCSHAGIRLVSVYPYVEMFAEVSARIGRTFGNEDHLYWVVGWLVALDPTEWSCVSVYGCTGQSGRQRSPRVCGGRPGSLNHRCATPRGRY